ncbi:hypothetical protein SPSIL_038600 [Sporomusa silvacetica DSM 10669]|uniref:Uncharacterized protein n=1 Tax=Sporomusa silvacetica DSM 10669 TaxID=1123289 RepID=A0ABZ3IPP2_9FIRM|nr:hypothetical protein SPSIL_02310 [Sporomusa silvacetica DSM 10669]
MHACFFKRAINEINHAEKTHCSNTLFRRYTYCVNLKPIHISSDIVNQLENDHLAEEGAASAFEIAPFMSLGVKTTTSLTIRSQGCESNSGELLYKGVKHE